MNEKRMIKKERTEGKKWNEGKRDRKNKKKVISEGKQCDIVKKTKRRKKHTQKSHYKK